MLRKTRSMSACFRRSDDFTHSRRRPLSFVDFPWVMEYLLWVSLRALTLLVGSQTRYPACISQMFSFATDGERKYGQPANSGRAKYVVAETLTVIQTLEYQVHSVFIWETAVRKMCVSTSFCRIIMVALCNTAYFCPVISFYLSSFFFPRLISAVGDWMSTILLHMVWP